MSNLTSKKCVPCRGGTPPLTHDQIEPLRRQVSGWDVIQDHHIVKTFKFEDFQTALDFVNRVGTVAEAEDHHPDICFGWGKAEITLWTHKAKGLTENDFILAAKIDEITAH